MKVGVPPEKSVCRASPTLTYSLLLRNSWCLSTSSASSGVGTYFGFAMMCSAASSKSRPRRWRRCESSNAISAAGVAAARVSVQDVGEEEGGKEVSWT